MIKILKMRKRLKKIFEVVDFKAANPQSKLYGNFKVKAHKIIDKENDINQTVYEFLTYKIISDSVSKSKTFYSSNMEQITVHRFDTTFKNDIEVVEIIFNEVDKNIFYYRE